MKPLDQMDPAVFYDAVLRFTTPSSEDPHVNYLQQLDSYEGNGECDCPNFIFAPKGQPYSKRDLCAKRVTPAEAIERGLAKLPKSGRVSDAMRCKHLVDARDQLATAVIKSISHAEKIHAAKTQQ